MNLDENGNWGKQGTWQTSACPRRSRCLNRHQQPPQ